MEGLIRIELSAGKNTLSFLENSFSLLKSASPLEPLWRGTEAQGVWEFELLLQDLRVPLADEEARQDELELSDGNSGT